MADSTSSASIQDTIWQTVRYVLIAGGMYLAGKGKIDPSQVASTADSIIQIGGSIVSVGTMIWGLVIKWKTVPVPASVGARPDVPTTSPVTGSLQQ